MLGANAELEPSGVECGVAFCASLWGSHGCWLQLAGGMDGKDFRGPQYPHPLSFWSSPVLGDCGWREGERQLESLQALFKGCPWGLGD